MNCLMPAPLIGCNCLRFWVLIDTVFFSIYTPLLSSALGPQSQRSEEEEAWVVAGSAVECKKAAPEALAVPSRPLVGVGVA